MEALFDLLGRLHPVVVHLPIGIFLLLALVEFAGLFRHGPRLTSAQRTFILAVGLVIALATSLFGWLLAREGGYNAVLLERHQWLGFAFAALAAVLLFVQVRGWRRAYAALLTLSVAVLAAAGHFGGTLTHGENYLTASLEPDAGAAPKDPAQALVFADVIHPILEQRCTACHGPTKSNGDLRYDTLEELLKGGKSGPAFKPGEAAVSRMIQRIHLPLDAKEHMPPKGKTQLTEDEIALLEWWIEAGAPTTQRVAELNPPAGLAEAIATRLGVPPEPPPDRAAMLASAAAIEQKLGIVIRPMAMDEPWLAANARLRQREFTDADLAELAPIARALHRLDVGETAVTDAGLRLVAAMSNLRRLHLDRTAVTDAGLAHLAGLSHLESINLHATGITDAGLVTLRALPRLRSLYLWQTEVTPAAAAKFVDEQTDKLKITRWKREIAALEARIRAEHVTADLGASLQPVQPAKSPLNAAGAALASQKSGPVAKPLTLPSPVVRDAKQTPAEPDPLAGEGRSTPGNDMCPVSGEPIDRNVTTIVEGRTIAFCCERCREKFMAQPAKYPLALSP